MNILLQIVDNPSGLCELETGLVKINCCTLSFFLISYFLTYRFFFFFTLTKILGGWGEGTQAPLQLPLLYGFRDGYYIFSEFRENDQFLKEKRNFFSHKLRQEKKSYIDLKDFYVVVSFGEKFLPKKLSSFLLHSEI